MEKKHWFSVVKEGKTLEYNLQDLISRDLLKIGDGYLNAEEILSEQAF